MSIAAFFSGCARYQYVLVDPARPHVTVAREAAVVPMPPLEYTLAADGPRLAVRVMNRSSEPVRLLGEKSYVVDPAGGTHPLPGGTVAPNAHIGLVFPPEPQVYRSSPHFSFGFGFGGYGGPYDHMLYSGLAYEPWFYGPTEFYAVNPPHYWEWKTGEVRVRFSYEEGGKNFEHNFAIDRQRVK